MKKLYSTPRVDVAFLPVTDIICSSNNDIIIKNSDFTDSVVDGFGDFE